MVEEACANRGVAKADLERTSLLGGEVPNMRGTGFAIEA
jgi:hypothetical protein